MYDMAKRSLAFTVATGGLLLTGTGYAPAEAAVGFGTLPGPAQAQGADILKASPSSVSTPISVRGPESPAQAAPRQDVHVLTPAAPHVPSDPGSGAAASSTVKNSGGILSGNSVQIPIDLGLNLCANQVDAVAMGNHVAPGGCGGSNAAGGANSGSSATVSTSHSGGILSGNTIQAPVNVPLNVCGNQVTVGGLDNRTGGSTCINQSGTTSASSVTANSGGIASGNSVQVPINVPANVCGNQGSVIGIDNEVGPALCGQGSMPPPSNSPSSSPSGTPSTSPSISPSTSAGGTPSSCGSCSPSPSSSSPASASPSNSPTTTSPGAPSTPAKPHGGGSLAGTGTEEGAVLAVAGAALLAGAGLRSASKRGRRAR